jgi:hypothetical protein
LSDCSTQRRKFFTCTLTTHWRMPSSQQSQALELVVAINTYNY